MRLSKLFYLLGIAGLLAFSNSAFAVVYNFGNLQAAPSGYTIQQANFGGDEFAASISYDSSSDPIDQTMSNLMAINRVIFSSISSTNSYASLSNNGYALNDIDFSHRFKRVIKSHHDKHHWDRQPPVTSPVPEPETYAMILAGLGLILFTTRNRKQDA